jgi:hypothetical protein
VAELADMLGIVAPDAIDPAHREAGLVALNGKRDGRRRRKQQGQGRLLA